MERQSPLAKAMRAVSSFLTGPSSAIEPRKGAAPLGSRQLHERSVTNGDLIREHATRIPSAAFERLANNDDIIWSIRQTLRRSITEMPWRIAPDTKRFKADIKRWQDSVELNLAMPGVEVDFQPQAMPLEFFVKAQGALRDLLREEWAANHGDLSNNVRLREFFENCEKHFNVIAEGHIVAVERVFDRPSVRDMSSYQHLLDRTLDDLTLYDAAAIVKVPMLDGSGLGEIYNIPGREVRLYRCKDLSQPAPPNIAYDWSKNDQIQAYYNNLELLYLMMNPQADGYGKPPMEVLIEQVMASLYGDAYILDFFSNNNMPRGVFDLGPNVDEGERLAVEREWNQKVSQGLRRIIFVSNHENVKGWVPIPTDNNSDAQIVELIKLWANRKCAAFGLSLNDIGFTEDLHRTTSEVQKDITQSRGINSFARGVQNGFNAEIVRGYVWVRDEPDNPACVTGHAVPIFPFRDVRFEFEMGDTDGDDKEDENDIQLVRNGILTINELRRKRGEPPRAGGDTLVVFEAGSPITVESLSDLGQQQALQGQPGAQPPAPSQQQPAIPGKPQAALPPGKDDHDQMEKRMLGLAREFKAILDE